MGKRAVAVVLVVCACGGAKPAGSPPAVADKSPPARVDPGPPATRDALLHATFAALAARDVDALVKLGDLDAIERRIMVCAQPEDKRALDAERRESIVKLMKPITTAGARVELIGVAKDEPLAMFQPGERAGKRCTAKVRVAVHSITLDVRVTTATGAEPSHAEVFAFEADGAWFLSLGPKVDLDPLRVRAMRDFKDKVCACKDTACIEVVSEQMSKWAQDHGPRDDKPSEEEMKLGSEIGREMAKCITAVMSVTP